MKAIKEFFRNLFGISDNKRVVKEATDHTRFGAAVNLGKSTDIKYPEEVSEEQVEASADYCLNHKQVDVVNTSETFAPFREAVDKDVAAHKLAERKAKLAESKDEVSDLMFKVGDIPLKEKKRKPRNKKKKTVDVVIPAEELQAKKYGKRETKINK